LKDPQDSQKPDVDLGRGDETRGKITKKGMERSRMETNGKEEMETK